MKRTKNETIVKPVGVGVLDNPQNKMTNKIVGVGTSLGNPQNVGANCVRHNSGAITLIVLIITIIMLILVAVTITVVLDTGLFDKAKEVALYQ